MNRWLPILCAAALASGAYYATQRPLFHQAWADRAARPSMPATPPLHVQAVVPDSMTHGARLPDPAPAAPDPDEFPALVEATRLDAPIYRRAESDPSVVGYARPGTPLPASAPLSRSSGCKEGDWREVWGEGFVCTADAFRVLAGADGTSPDGESSAAISVATAPLPTPYAHITDKGAPRYTRVPTAGEVAQAESARTEDDEDERPEVVDMYMDGDYYIAIADEVEVGGRHFYKTVRGYYVAAEDAAPMPAPTLMGEFLEADDLPLAFVYREDTEALCAGADRRYEPCGRVDKFARFSIAREIEQNGETLLVSEDGFAVRGARCRVIRAIERPEGVRAGDKWIHIDLAEQAVIAYEGDTPIFASLVSSGRDGYDTPTGLYKVMRKFGSKTMIGDDDVDGVYDVGEVPWALYYHRGYALHGAYWHNIFGHTKSHGCTNIAPADAHFLFWWSGPEIPRGWHGLRYRHGGTRVYLSNDEGQAQSGD